MLYKVFDFDFFKPNDATYLIWLPVLWQLVLQKSIFWELESKKSKSFIFYLQQFMKIKRKKHPRTLLVVQGPIWNFEFRFVVS